MQSVVLGADVQSALANGKASAVGASVVSLLASTEVVAEFCESDAPDIGGLTEAAKRGAAEIANDNASKDVAHVFLMDIRLISIVKN